MTSVYDQRTATEMYKRESFAEGRAEGMQQGILKGVEKGRAEGREEGREEGRAEGMQQGKIRMIEAFAEMVRDKILTVKEAAKRLGVSESEFLQLAK